MGNGAVLYQEVISAELGKLALFADDSRNIIRASTIGRLSLSTIEHNPSENEKSLVPQYIRKSDAELKIGC